MSTAAERKDHLRRLRSALMARSADIEAAIIDDLPQPSIPDVPREVAWSCSAIDQTLDELDNWMRPVQVEPSPWLRHTSSSVIYEARGVCLIFGPWNVPFSLVIEPTVAALAAGNTALIKPNSLTPATSTVVGDLIRSTFDERLVAAFNGGDDVAETLLDQPVDHIFFTGSPAVGKVVMAAAARHLASVTLELGGKCPAIVDGTHDVAESARLIGEGRHANGGQLCFAVDHVWVERSVSTEFLSHYEAWIDNDLLAGGALDPSEVTHIIDQRNMDRIMSLIDDAESRGARVIRGGRPVPGQSNLIEPTIIGDAPLDSKVMTEEIFGPVLPIQTFDDTDDLLSRLRSAPKPLALYIHSDDDNFVDTILDGTSSGGVTVNGFGTHVSEPRVGFGGVNNSGNGRYHGIWDPRVLQPTGRSPTPPGVLRPSQSSQPVVAASNLGRELTQSDELQERLVKRPAGRLRSPTQRLPSSHCHRQIWRHSRTATADSRPACGTGCRPAAVPVIPARWNPIWVKRLRTRRGQSCR